MIYLVLETAEAAEHDLMGPVIVTNLRTAGMVIPGRNCQFECGIEPNPHNVITWLFNGHEISPEKFQV